MSPHAQTLEFLDQARQFAAAKNLPLDKLLKESLETMQQTKTDKLPVYFITGSSRGIGRSVALEICRREKCVMSVHFGAREADAKQTAQEISDLGSHPVVIKASLFNAPEQTAERLVEDYMLCVQKLTGEKKLDFLVNNAATYQWDGLLDVTEKSVHKIFDANFFSPLFLIQKFEPYLREGGSIVNVSSSLGHIVSPNNISYGSAKAALLKLTRDISAHFGRKQVRVNAVSPGLTLSESVQKWLDQDPHARKMCEDQTVFQRIGEIRDIVPAIIFLLSEESAWISGQNLQVQGGANL